MKKMRISVLAVAALLLGVIGSAFTAPKAEKNTLLDGWFKYNGGTKTLPSNYTYYGTSEPCDDIVKYCAMKGDRQASPNQARPTQASIDAAQSASTNFTVPVPDLVHFEP